MRSPHRLLAAVVAASACFFSPPTSRADEPFLKPNDIIAFIGGEDMVVASELGYLELLLVRALPDHKLRFRCLAWEGDTVFEQRRDLNYPTLEQQLDQIGATVVVAQFGQMESLAGKEKLPGFVAAYEKLIERARANRKRRVIVVSANPMMQKRSSFTKEPESLQVTMQLQRETLESYHNAVFHLVERLRVRMIDSAVDTIDGLDAVDADHRPLTHDGIHLSEHGAWLCAKIAAEQLTGSRTISPSDEPDALRSKTPPDQQENRLQNLIRAKNRLWFQYSRPQNWAFLAGDRTNQPSSRDHLDPSKRWFPAELEQFLPLIEAKEREIDALAAQLAKP